MLSLKDEALRTRHWEKLMEKTGQHFDMSADRFTLENMFAMELHKYQVGFAVIIFLRGKSKNIAVRSWRRIFLERLFLLINEVWMLVDRRVNINNVPTEGCQHTNYYS